MVRRRPARPSRPFEVVQPHRFVQQQDVHGAQVRNVIRCLRKRRRQLGGPFHEGQRGRIKPITQCDQELPGQCQLTRLGGQFGGIGQHHVHRRRIIIRTFRAGHQRLRQTDFRLQVAAFGLLGERILDSKWVRTTLRAASHWRRASHLS